MRCAKSPPDAGAPARDLAQIAETAALHHDVVSCAGLLAKAAVEVAQAAFAERGEWVLTEQGIARGPDSAGVYRASWPRRAIAPSSSDGL